ncbi:MULTISPECIES: hypothetical protein [unclassified Streptomyces]|uniref:hypothetical protein n=1 Tax=unclassified Streptomyces TaxID=2593676 RepID=UPI001F357341|nr:MULTISPECIES: hypothetical protein [unclassified Streptomyces]MCF0086696.1 hypothetical protein [Streptomyces sp. MH192]MCF0098850.1 hypothetical protein [Streptomyces sp. MH191]
MDRIAQHTPTDTTAPGGLLVDFDSVLGDDCQPLTKVHAGTTVTATVTIRSIDVLPGGHARGIIDGSGGHALIYIARGSYNVLASILTVGAKVMVRGKADRIGSLPTISVFAARQVNA